MMSQEPLSLRTRVIILVVAFLGWFFGGIQIGITNLVMLPAAEDLIQKAELAAGLSEKEIADTIMSWYAYFQCAFLFGAAAGGYFFGRLGDRIGRTRALGVSVIWFSIFTGASYLAQTPSQLLLLRFIACLGVGGCWPNGVALVSEVWAKVARPVMASLIGMAGNLGIFTIATLGKHYEVTPESWRWVLLIGASPILLGLIALFLVKESPSWTAAQGKNSGSSSQKTEEISVFRRPYLGITIIGIALATVPLFGGWGSANWIIPWAAEIGPPELKAEILQVRSVTSIIGSALAGVIATLVGRRLTYFFTSLGALLTAQYVFWFTTPLDSEFLALVGLLGFFNGLFFGWLPFFLPELFESRVRATGAGVSFNFGRILTATTIFLTPAMTQAFGGSYAQIGRTTSLIFAIGMVVVLLAPDTSKRKLDA
ncbi:MAG: MFS transporter [Opitutales bacterium]